MEVCKMIIIYFVSVVLPLLVMSEDVSKDNQTAVVGGPPLNISKVTEGGGLPVNKDTTHMGREHMIPVKPRPEHTTANPEHVPSPPKVKPTEQVVNSSMTNETVLPQFEIPEKNDYKKSMPRKGVNFTDFIVNNKSSTTTTSPTTTTTTTVKPKKKKPTITEADDAPVPVVKVKPNHTINHGIGIEAITEKQKKPDYVVPIVVVILLVPLVAIIISVLYKRGSEWWQHRHYRRMDFLIDGMYNN